MTKELKQLLGQLGYPFDLNPEPTGEEILRWTRTIARSDHNRVYDALYDSLK